MKPIIAITPEAVELEPGEKRGAYCGVAYTQAIEAAGGVPLILPLTRDAAVLDHFLESCHGLMLIGGGDVGERYYARKLTDAERATITGTDEVLDEMEIYLVREALDRDLPLLGICRGMQVLNVACAGTLIPDIKLRKPDALEHSQQKPYTHIVTWEPGARLTEVLGDGCESVNSTHHQAVDQIAPGFEVVARAPDGIAEAMEKPGARLVCAVQFHPERLVREAPQFLRLFEALVEAASTNAR